ncbi:glycosyltransferase family 39 protein [Granulicella sp. S190]|uniref:ArnT family glycosyltransferase n=1 Tax=Granulicella sp. S190 TaxID=1747226 RepID=UPI00131E7549|nr:glycosyltransferase family 39 protein [Granulicella sp. S190]
MNKGKLKTVLWTALPLVAGLALRLWYVMHAGRVEGDSLIYASIAKNWLKAGVYGFSVGPNGPVPTLIRLPGYPIFLAVCFRLLGFSHYTAIMVLQSLIDLCTCLLISALARRFFGQRAALAALWLAALCPFTAIYAAALLTETLTLFSIALTFYCLERWRSAGAIPNPTPNRWLFATTVAMAYSVLLRPEQGLLPATVVPAMIWIVWQRSGRRLSLATLSPVVLAACCVVLPLAPWAARNWHTFRVIQPLAPRNATDPGEVVPVGFQHWYRTWAIDFASTEQVYWNYDSTDLRVGDLPTRAFDSDEQYAETAALFSEYNQKDNATRAFDQRFEALAQQRIHASLLRYYVFLPAARLANMLFRPRPEMMQIGLDWWNWHEYRGKTLLSYASAALNLAYFALAAIGLWRWRRRGWTPHAPIVCAMLAFTVLRCALLLTLDNSEPRYTLELFPLLIVWASYLFRVDQRETQGEAGIQVTK